MLNQRLQQKLLQKLSPQQIQLIKLRILTPSIYGHSTPSISDDDNIMNMDEAKKKRTERRIKLKRVFNYDAEMKFLKSFWDLKSKEMDIDEFQILAKKTLVDTDQVNESILEYFIEEEKMRLKIVELDMKKGSLELQIKLITKEIRDIQDVLKEDAEDSKRMSKQSPISDPY